MCECVCVCVYVSDYKLWELSLRCILFIRFVRIFHFSLPSRGVADDFHRFPFHFHSHIHFAADAKNLNVAGARARRRERKEMERSVECNDKTEERTNKLETVNKSYASLICVNIICSDCACPTN